MLINYYMNHVIYSTRTSVRSRAPCSRPAGWLWDLRSTFTPKALNLIHTQLSHSLKSHFPKNPFPQISFSQNTIIPFSQNLIFKKSHISETHFSEILSSVIPFSQNYIFPESHFYKMEGGRTNEQTNKLVGGDVHTNKQTWRGGHVLKNEQTNIHNNSDIK